MGRKLQHLANGLALALLVALDARDVWFKTQWFGPDDSFAFPAEIRATLSPSDSVRPSDASELSGWSSFLDKCESLTPFIGGHFQHALATNCELMGDGDDVETGAGVLLESMIITSDMRVDAMAWTACRLLQVYRRPPICHEDLVTGFLRRYQLTAPHVSPDMMAEVMSPAEAEVFDLLEVISNSSPLSGAVCVSGFEVDAASNASVSAASPTLFGCGSPSRRLSAFVGRHLPGFAAMLADKAWLTMDDVSILDAHFRVRQNARTSYSVAPRPSTPGKSPLLVLKTHAAISLSCSGVLYNAMVLMDVVLLVAHAWSSLELSRVFKASGTLQPESETSKTQLNRMSFFLCSLSRSTPVALLTLGSCLLSWLLVLPSSVALQFSSSATAKLHVYLTMVRMWSLLLLLVNLLWDGIVSLNEKRAYFVASRTFVASWELIAVVLFLFHLLRGRFFSLRSAKHALELQRSSDANTFSDFVSLSNSLGDEIVVPGSDVLWLIYSPLVQLLLLGVLLVAFGLSVRYAVVVRRLNTKAAASKDTITTMAGYTRLPLEELLDSPIRARCLVRFACGLERAIGGEHFLLAVQHLAHGVLVESKHFVGQRRGFFRALPVDLPADGRGIEPTRESEAEDEASGSPKRRRYVSPLRS